MTLTAVIGLRIQLADLIGTIAMLSGDKVYNEGDEAIRGAALPYAVLGSWSEPEDSGRYYGQPGAEQTGQIKWWGTDKDEAQRAFADGKALLDGATLTMTGQKTIRCRLGYLTDFAEPDPDVGGHVVVSRLRTQTVET